MFQARSASALIAICCVVCVGGSARGEEPARAKAIPDPRQKALFEKLQVGRAWERTQGDPKVVVGVIDNGFDFFHPDLRGQLASGYYYAGGYHSEVYPNLAHGTLVAGLIVARGQGEGGMAGLAPNCKVLTASQGAIEHKLLSLQREFFREHPEATMQEFQKAMLEHAAELREWGKTWVNYQVEGAAEAIRFLADRGVRVINFSGGLRQSLVPDQAVWKKLEDAFAYAASKEVVIVVSAGNNASRTEDYPGDDATVIIAGATLLDDERWESEVEVRGLKVKQGSNYGERLTCMAPVQDLLVCLPHEGRMYEADAGPYGAVKEEFKGIHDVLEVGATSSAAPIVSALAALVFSARPDLDAATVVRLIQHGCDDLGEPGFDIHTGHGRVNFAKTLELAVKHGKE